ncbi:MAG: GntR family transcriptional regulator [Gaiella sp.]
MLHLISQIIEGDRLIEAPPLRDQVYARLREAIITCELAPGARISLAEVAERYGVSTMPVRDALQLLEQEGLVETSARRWTRVVEIDASTVAEAAPLVALLEQYALVSAPHPSAEQIDSLRAANSLYAAALESGDASALIAADAEFHDALVGLAGNPTLERAVRAARTRLHLFRARVVRPEVSVGAAEEHERVIACLETGDLVGALQAVVDNWERGLHQIAPEALPLRRVAL